MRQSKQILIFSSERGHEHGYLDGWAGDYFYYTGAGQKGDQDIESNRHNGRILRHQENGDVIRLMIETRQGYHRYEGELTLVDFDYFQTLDTNGQNRRAIRFILEATQDTTASMSNGDNTLKRQPYRKPNTTTRQGLVTSRVGQGYYRRALLEKYNHRCAVTKQGPTEILIASHIVPWKDSTDEERLDENNGILLSPNLDALFDKHLISFDKSGGILIGKTLTSEQQNALGITGKEAIDVSSGMEDYLARHRELLR